ncbi:hypothetical protein CFO_g2447 [Ceratocystis platani]|uniref:Uncharacterized protein n=1 Tax=Ceratocystis fimbriata f. sp. platani TaxID=88771 RepID=A0A0F8B1S5_CERFI|nr:hypothetical protein CFO_g2447 [Ceratocystis platani]
MEKVYPTTPDYREPTTLLTSVVPVKTADVESVPMDQDPELESGDVESISADQDPELESGDVESISADQDLYLESADVGSIPIDQDLNLESTDVEPIPIGQGLVEADPTTDAGIAISPTEVPKSDYPESAGTSSLEKVDSILKDASSTELEEEAIRKAEDLAMDAGPTELVQLIGTFQEKAAVIEEMIESRGQATNQVPDNGEVGPETSEKTTDPLVSQLVDIDVMTAVFMIRLVELNTIKAPSQEAIEDDEKDMFFSFTAEDDFSIDEEPGSSLVEIGKPSPSKLGSIGSDKVSGDKISDDKISGERISGLVEILRNQRMMGKQQLPVSEGEEDGVKYPATTETTTDSLKYGQEDSDGSSGRKQNPTSGVDSLD